MTPEKQSPLAAIWATMRETQAWRTPARCTDRRLPTACAVTSPTSSGQVQIRPRLSAASARSTWATTGPRCGTPSTSRCGRPPTVTPRANTPRQWLRRPRRSSGEVDAARLAREARIADLEGALEAGLDARPVELLTRWYEQTKITEAEEKTAKAGRLITHRYGVLLQVDEAHHRDDDNDENCSCGTPTSACAVYQALDRVRDRLYKWEKEEVTRARAGQPHSLPLPSRGSVDTRPLLSLTGTCQPNDDVAPRLPIRLRGGLRSAASARTPQPTSPDAQARAVQPDEAERVAQGRTAAVRVHRVPEGFRAHETVRHASFRMTRGEAVPLLPQAILKALKSLITDLIRMARDLPGHSHGRSRVGLC